MTLAKEKSQKIIRTSKKSCAAFLFFFVLILITQGCSPPKRRTVASPVGTIVVDQFQGKPSAQWRTNSTTGSLKTNSNQLNFTGTCPNAIVSYLKMHIDGVDTNAQAVCLKNTFSISLASGLSDNWNSPGNDGFGYKIEFLSYDTNGTVLPNVSIASYYLIIKTQAPGSLTFTDITYFKNNLPVLTSINNGDALNIAADLNSGGIGNLCLAAEAEVRINGSYLPSSSDEPIASSPVVTSAHAGGQFQYRICLGPDETKNLLITHPDSFGNSPASSLNLSIHFQTSSNIGTIIPSDLASSFTTQSLAPEFSSLTSGSISMEHVFMGASESEPQLPSSTATGLFLDFDLNHYFAKLNQ